MDKIICKIFGHKLIKISEWGNSIGFWWDNETKYETLDKHFKCERCDYQEIARTDDYRILSNG